MANPVPSRKRVFDHFDSLPCSAESIRLSAANSCYHEPISLERGALRLLTERPWSPVPICRPRLAAAVPKTHWERSVLTGALRTGRWPLRWSIIDPNRRSTNIAGRGSLGCRPASAPRDPPQGTSSQARLADEGFFTLSRAAHRVRPGPPLPSVSVPTALRGFLRCARSSRPPTEASRRASLIPLEVPRRGGRWLPRALGSPRDAAHQHGAHSRGFRQDRPQGRRQAKP